MQRIVESAKDDKVFDNTICFSDVLLMIKKKEKLFLAFPFFARRYLLVRKMSRSTRPRISSGIEEEILLFLFLFSLLVA